MNPHPLDECETAAGANLVHLGGISAPADYGDPQTEHAAAVSGAAIFDARLRGLIEVTGKDRASWLNNLVTNRIKDLTPGQGNYTFATNIKGRILLDFNMIVLPDAIWIDIDRRYVTKAMAHFDRYLITEDVRLKDRSDDLVRIALLGPKSAEIADAIGAVEPLNMASLASTAVTLVQKNRLLVRHDFAGVFGVELYIDAPDAAACWNRLLEIGAPVRLRPIGHTAVNILRIEAGIPLLGEDIDEEVLPAETQQIARAVSYTKGCYLGQEVIERMRSRSALARSLVGLRLNSPVIAPATMHVDDKEIGKITSACHSYALNGHIALGYVKTTHAQPGTRVVVSGDRPVEAEIVPLPFRQHG